MRAMPAGAWPPSSPFARRAARARWGENEVEETAYLMELQLLLAGALFVAARARWPARS